MNNTRPAHYECAALPTELHQHDEGKNLVFKNKHQINTKLTGTSRWANGKTLISCGFAGFWDCFDLLITNQLLYRLSHSSKYLNYHKA